VGVSYDRGTPVGAFEEEYGYGRCSIFHRDIKPENMLIAEDVRGLEGWFRARYDTSEED
jgi:serine/threonine protein kinase